MLQSFRNDCLNTIPPLVISSSMIVTTEELVMSTPSRFQVISTLGFPDPTHTSKAVSPSFSVVFSDIITNPVSTK